MRTFPAVIATLSLASSWLLAQTPGMSCKDQGSYCEIRENTIPALSSITVDGRQNGGISVKGANRSDILVRAMVQSSRGTLTEGKDIAAQVVLHTAGGTISADGPAGREWSVTYEIFVPTTTNLRLTATNGGVSVASVASSIEVHAVNGGISLSNVGGNVRGETVNGGISATLTGGKWNGLGLDLATTNGGISLRMPEQFSALLDVATVKGGMSVHLPKAYVRSGDHRLNTTLGAGGPLIRVHTKNGGVSITGAGAA